ncbi:MAG TPA: SUF system NifU family Fe-S cluster assembly protein [Gemmataceae bacterium]|nr:SUF system NifU family Fe-S cluster assembly protein [Gemmataceae bacterium]
MSDLRELYQDLIKDHSKKPRNFRVLEGDARRVEGYNPLCGDRFTIYLDMDGGVVKDVAFQGTGCAISTASASMMTQCLKGKTRAEAEQLFQKFHHLLTGETSEAEEMELGKLAVFSGVRKFPVRVKCATLAWHTLRAALEGAEKTISTE